ncbi:hypothetical protein ACET3Z_004407 [Daucus carota]
MKEVNYNHLNLDNSPFLNSDGSGDFTSLCSIKQLLLIYESLFGANQGALGSLQIVDMVVVKFFTVLNTSIAPQR